MNRRILFVDDEPNELEELRQVLRPIGKEFSLEFAESAKKALEILSKARYDVVVSDLRMPAVCGVELLNEVNKRYPHVVRIILSDESDKDPIMKSVSATHQYLPKPFNVEELKCTLTRAFALRDLSTNVNLKVIVDQMKSLPSKPKLYNELMAELQSPNSSMKKVGEIISKDVGMSTKLLQLVNSTFFGMRVHVSNPTHAARLLGPETIKGLVLSVQVFSQFDQNKIRFLSLDRLLNHSAVVGSLAKKLALNENQDQAMVDNAFVAGMLHDTGKLALADNLTDQYSKTLALAKHKGVTIWEAEQETIGVTHAEVGGYLLGQWGLPDDVVKALAFHHCPMNCLEKSFSPLTAVHVANVLAHKIKKDETNKTTKAVIDFAYLEEVGLANRYSM